MKLFCTRCHADLTELREAGKPDLVCPACRTPVPKPAAGEELAPRPGDAASQLTPPTEQVVVRPPVSPGAPGKPAEDGSDTRLPGRLEEVHDMPTATPDLEVRLSETASGSSSGSTSVSGEEIGHDFGNYEILAEVGRGAMGIVYRARQKHLNREVAIKVLLAGAHASRKQVARFYKEAQAAARLRHPSIVPIHEISRWRAWHYYTMDFIHGKSLNKLIAEGVISIRRALEITIELADALDYAHGHKVIHRDVKPSNILIDTDGRPHLMDFGLAKVLDSGTRFTQTGSAIGTPAYMSPEAAAGDSARIDHHADIYSLGAVLYELVTGRPPFEGDTMMNVIMQVLNHEPPLPRSINPKIHRDIQTITMKAMDKIPDRRYQTAKEFADDLRRFLAGEAIHARPAGMGYRIWRHARKHLVAILALALAGTIAAAATFALAVQQARTRAIEHDLQKARDEVVKMVERSKGLIEPPVVTVVEDYFDEPPLAGIWKPRTDPAIWTVADGVLSVRPQGEAILMLAPQIPLKGNIRLEYTAQVQEGSELPRLDCLIGPDPNLAYRLILDSTEGKPRLLIQRSGVNLAQANVLSFEKGKTYRYALERKADLIRFDVRNGDGTPIAVLLYSDLDIIRDLGAFQLGFAAWDTSVHFDRVVLTRQGVPEHSPMFHVQEQSILSHDYDVAIRGLEDILAVKKGGLAEYKALHRIGRCWELKAKPSNALGNALDYYQRVPDDLSAGEEAEARRLWVDNTVRKFFCLAQLGRLPEATGAVVSLAERNEKIDASWVWHVRGVTQRCLTTPRLDEALTIFSKARFDVRGLESYARSDAQKKAIEAGAVSIHDLSAMVSDSLYDAFLAQAIQLGVRFSQGTHPNFQRVIEVYRAFPDKQMVVAFEAGLRRAIQLVQLDASLELLDFAGKNLPVSPGITSSAVDLGKGFCSVRQYLRVEDVYKSYPANELVECYGMAVKGLLAQGERDLAYSLFTRSREIFRPPEDAGPVRLLVERERSDMAGQLARAFADAGQIEGLLKIVLESLPGTDKLLEPAQRAIAKAMEKEDAASAIKLLRAIREKALPGTRALVPQTVQLGDKLAEKQMVQSLQDLYNAFPCPELGASFIKMLRNCHENRAYTNCIQVLKFVSDRLTLGELADSKQALEDFLVLFASDSNRRGKYQELTATHRAFPSPRMLPQFDEAMDAALRSDPADYDSLVRLFPHARQFWPFPEHADSHFRLIETASKLASMAEGSLGPAGVPAMDSRVPPPRAEEFLKQLIEGFRAAMATSEKNPVVHYGLAVEYADLLLISKRPEEARTHLAGLVRSLPSQHPLYQDALLRLAAMTPSGEDSGPAAAVWQQAGEPKTAIDWAIANGRAELAIRLLAAAKSRSASFPADLAPALLGLGELLSKKNMPSTFQRAYLIHPLPGLASGLAELLDLSVKNKTYIDVIDLLGFVGRRLEKDELKNVEPQITQTFFAFAAEAGKTGRYRELIAAHQVFLSDRLAPQFVAAIDVALATRNFQAFIKLCGHARRHWPFPQAPELHPRLLSAATLLVSLSANRPAEAGGDVKPPGADATLTDAKQAQVSLAALIAEFKASMTESEKDPETRDGLAIELVDILLASRRLDEARQYLHQLVTSLREDRHLRGEAILRLAALTTLLGTREAALEHWKAMNGITVRDNYYSEVSQFILLPTDPPALSQRYDPAFQRWLTLLRLRMNGGGPKEVTERLAEIVRLQTQTPTWYSCLADAALRHESPAGPATGTRPEPTPPAEKTPGEKPPAPPATTTP